MKHARAIGEKTYPPGGAAIVVAILGETKILLIKETSQLLPHYWKLVSETLNTDESVLDGLCRGVDEEAELKLETLRVKGSVVKITDPRIRVVKKLVRSHMVATRIPHRLHFWGLLTTDQVVMSLSGKHLANAENEIIDTMAFNISELDGMRDFHPHHRELILSIPKAT